MSHCDARTTCSQNILHGLRCAHIAVQAITTFKKRERGVENAAFTRESGYLGYAGYGSLVLSSAVASYRLFVRIAGELFDAILLGRAAGALGNW